MLNALVITVGILAVLYGLFVCAVNAAHLILIAEDEKRKSQGLKPLNPEHTEDTSFESIFYRFLVSLVATVYVIVLLFTWD